MSLLSVMLAILLGSFVLLAAVEGLTFLRITTQQQYQMQYDRTQLLLAGTLIQNDLRNVFPLEHRILLAPKGNAALSGPVLQVLPPGDPLISTWRLNRSGSGKITSKSSVIAVHYISHDVVYIHDPAQAHDTVIEIPAGLDLQAKDTLALSDNHVVEFAQIKRIRRGGGMSQITLMAPLQTNFANGALIQQVYFSVFYIGKTTRKNQKGDAILALYQQSLSGRRNELVANVSELTASKLNSGVDYTVGNQDQTEHWVMSV